MADTNKESTGQEPSDKKAAADEKAAAASPESETKPVADLLLTILNDVQDRVQSRAAVAAATAAEETLVGKALEAVEQFRDIVAALALAPNPQITRFVADVNAVTSPNSPIILSWSSIGARRLSLTVKEPGATIDKDLGELTPTAEGSRTVNLTRGGDNVFKATASGFCGQSGTPAEQTVFGKGF